MAAPESKVAAPKGAATERNAQGVDVLAAIEDSINECNDVTCPQCRRLAKALAAVAELMAKAEKVAGWLDAQATAAQGRAQDTRFPSLAEANAADARNYRAIAKDLRAALAPFQTGGAE